MNRKQINVLLIFVLLVSGAGLAVYKRTTLAWEARSTPSEKILGTFAINDVARIVIQTNDNTVTLAKKNDLWVVCERDDYPADFARVGSFIEALWQLKPVQDIKIDRSQLSRLDLVTPAKGLTHTATLVDLQNKDAKRIAALLIGKKFRQKVSPTSEETFQSGLFVMPAEVTPPKVSLISESLDQLQYFPDAWLNKAFLRIDQIHSVTVASGADLWTLSRETESDKEWKLANATSDEILDNGRIPSFPSIFADPHFVDILPKDAMGDKPETTVTIETFDRFTYTLKFGKPEGKYIPTTVEVTANVVRIPGKNEGPEEKNWLDAEFTTTAKILTEKLAKAKEFEQRVYLLPKPTFIPILKPRHELLGAKPDLPPVPAHLLPAPAIKSIPGSKIQQPTTAPAI